MNQAILNEEVQKYIRENLQEDLSKLILKGSPFKAIETSDLATQIFGKKKAEKKLPLWFNTEGILYPPSLNLEQTSSETTAEYKAKLVSGNRLLDLTGGFGIDSYFFSEKVEQVIHCEQDPELSNIAAHNFKMLGAENIITIAGDSIEYLKNQPPAIIYDWIFIDPARRDDYGGKVFLLNQCTPDVVSHLDLLLSKSRNILIKTSPLLDISAGIADLQNIKELHIVAVKNEVKELLWLLSVEPSEGIIVKTVNFEKDLVQYFDAVLDEQSTPASYAQPGIYLYEPNAAIMKSKFFGTLCGETGTAKLHTNSHLFTSVELKDFPGRRFRIKENLPYNKKILKKRKDLKKANITTRNFPKSVEAIRKELKIEDGGQLYLFFTTNLTNEKIVLVCEKV